MHPDGPTPLEMLWEDLYLVSGLGIMLLPLFPLTVPAVVLLGLVVVPLAVVGLLAVVIGDDSRVAVSGCPVVAAPGDRR
jgi:hypothetical protein